MIVSTPSKLHITVRTFPIGNVLTVICNLLMLCLCGATVTSAELPPGCNPQQPNTCLENPEDYQVPMFCLGGQTAVFQIGITEQLEVGFTLIFADGKANRSSYKLFFVDGDVARLSGKKKDEEPVTVLTCTESTGVCEGSISVTRAEQLEEELGFGDATVNLEVRKKGRLSATYCLGKFYDGDEVRQRNSRDQRILCHFTPAEGEDPSLKGSGFFSPNGYGFEHDDDDSTSSLFHMTMEGFDTDKTFKACIDSGDGNYREVFRFRSYGPDSSDSDIYGTLDTDEQGEFDKRQVFYSYDIERSVRAEEADLGSEATLSLDLSKINTSLTQGSATSAMKENRRRKRRRRRRRARREAASRSITRNSVAGQGVSLWLGGDPTNDGTIYVGESCSGDVPTAALGTIQCGDSEDRPGDPRKCLELERASGVTAGGGKLCNEPSSSFGLLILKVKDLTAGSYAVCINGAPLTDTLEVEDFTVGAEDKTHGEIKFTDKQEIADEADDISFLATALSEVNTVAVSDDNCATSELSVTIPHDD